MKVAYFTALRQIEVREAPPPRIANRQEVLLRVDKLGVCGSDIHYYVNGRVGCQQLDYPATLGHECAATVVEMGDAVTNVVVGDRVAVDPAVSCGECTQCRRGRPHTCDRLTFMGCPGQSPGALAEYVVMPATCCFPIPDSMTLEQAALAEPLSIAVHAVRLPALTPGRKVGILGAGPIGLCVQLAVRAVGPATVYATDLLEYRRDRARQCGADWVGTPERENVVEAIRAQEPDGLDYVFECAGEQACIDQATQLLTPGGTLIAVGIPETSRISLDLDTMRRHEITLKNVRRQNDCVAPAVELIAAGKVDVTPLVTHHFALAQSQDAFELVANYDDGVVKAIVDVTDAN